ncbi:hypothetical protein NQZ68_024320 [Dissostichus eleginoides]|nr:hypothetical protein NQZ68_024320 [Dissostichus eleginoides]
MDKFQSQQKQWLSSMNKNRIKSHVLDDAALLLEKLHALGLKPLLLLAYPPTKRVPGTCKIKVLMPIHAQLSTSAKTCLDNVEAIYKLMQNRCKYQTVSPMRSVMHKERTEDTAAPTHVFSSWTRLNPDQEENPDTPTPPQDPPNQLPDESFILNLVPSTTGNSRSTTTPGSQPPPTTKLGSKHPTTTTPGSQHPPTITPGSLPPPTITPGSLPPPTTKPGSLHPPTITPGSNYAGTITPNPTNAAAT